MKKSLLVILAAATLFAAGCGSKVEPVALKEGTPAYLLAKNLAVVIPALDPAKNTIIVKAKGIEVNAAEVTQVLQNNFGNRADQLKQADAAQLKDVYEKAAEQVAERKLMLAEAKKAGKTVDDAALNKVLEEQAKQFGGEQAFKDALGKQNISFDYVKDNIRESLTIEKWLEEYVSNKIVVPEEEIKKQYEQDKTATVRHILFLTKGKKPEEIPAIRKKAEEVLAKARGGEDFTELAKQYSEDPGSKDKGGLYEDFARGQMVKPFEDASFMLPVGQISDIVETTYGFHIIKVEGRKKETRTMDEVRKEIETALADSKKQTVVEDHIKDLKTKNGFKLIKL